MKKGAYLLTVTLFDGQVQLIKKSTLIHINAEGEKQEIVPEVTADECLAVGEECAESCTKLCEDKKGEYCKEHDYSGCALDVFCWCNACVIYDGKWCPRYESFNSCAEGVKGKYRSCIEACQSKREAAQDVSTCWQDCNMEFEEGIIGCKQAPCQEFCTDKGFAKGEWVRYTQEYGWDSCYCSSDQGQQFSLSDADQPQFQRPVSSADQYG